MTLIVDQDQFMPIRIVHGCNLIYVQQGSHPMIVIEQDVPFDATERPASDPPQVNDRNLLDDINQDDDHPAQAKADAIVAEIEAENAIININSIYARHKLDIEAMPPEIGARIDTAVDRRKREIKAEQEAAKAKEGAE